MKLPDDIARCRGVGTDQGEPEAACLDCERRTAGIDDYMHGRRVWWMVPPVARPCPGQLEPLK